jgi:hypothetical protein
MNTRSNDLFIRWTDYNTYLGLGAEGGISQIERSRRRRYILAVWRFSIQGNKVRYGNKKRMKLTEDGCNEPYKDRYWCPKLQWFQCEPCPFLNQKECENFEIMCGAL